VRFERQIVLREWGSAGQAALEASRAEIACADDAFVVAERYLHAAGVTEVVAPVAPVAAGASGPSVATVATVAGERQVDAPFVAAVEGLPWHAPASRAVGVGAAHALAFVARTLREASR
jgi:hypothetical protein